MEASERPKKIRKLSHEDQISTGERTLSAAGVSVSETDPGIQAAISNAEFEHKDKNGVDSILTAGSNADPGSTTTDKPPSKNQLKRERKRQEWEAGKELRKVKRKEKTKERKIRKREKHEREAEERKIKGQPEPTAVQYRHPTLLPITFLIDCGFDDKMMEKERISLGSQLTRAYSDNSRAPYQAHLIMSSWGGQLKERFDTVLDKHHLNWKGVQFTDADFVAAAEEATVRMRSARGGKMNGVFKKYTQSKQKRRKEHGNGDKTNAIESQEPSQPTQIQTETFEASAALDQQEQQSTDVPPDTNDDDHDKKDNTASIRTAPTPIPLPEPEIIYLTSDSPNTLESLHPYSTYIIGGLVDKNRHKGICYQKAVERGVKTAKLPIGEYMEMQSRFVLTTNHVVEIMVRWLECGDWGEAFMRVIPKRKGGKLRGSSKGDGADDGTMGENRVTNGGRDGGDIGDEHDAVGDQGDFDENDAGSSDESEGQGVKLDGDDGGGDDDSGTDDGDDSQGVTIHEIVD